MRAFLISVALMAAASAQLVEIYPRGVSNSRPDSPREPTFMSQACWSLAFKITPTGLLR